MSVVLVERVGRRFGSFAAVEGVDLTVGPGEVVGLLGANGAGKTTLMRMILGLLAPSSGEVALFGMPPDRKARLRVGYVPQGLGLWGDLTASENLEFAAGAFGVPANDPPAGAGQSLVRDLSLGVQRRVAFAVALQHGPELLVLDEPTSGVAPLARARLWEEIRARAETGSAVLVSTHYMDEARQADRLMLMAEGRVIGRGSEADIVGDLEAVTVLAPRWDDAYSVLDEAGMAATLAGAAVRVPGVDRDAVKAVLTAAGIEAAVDVEPATLEETMVLAAR